MLTYGDVRPWAETIRAKVAAREMPPWHADPRYGAFINDARLSRDEIDTITAWADHGASEGDAKDLPPLPAAAAEWKIGTPDRVFTMSQDFSIAPNAPDTYVYYTVPTKFEEDKWIQAAEIRPGNRKVVHHVIAHVLSPRALAKARNASNSETEHKEPIFYRDGGLARVKTDAPVIDDGAAANGGAFFERRSGEEDADGSEPLFQNPARRREPPSHRRVCFR